jgi:hypothetical protein
VTGAALDGWSSGMRASWRHTASHVREGLQLERHLPPPARMGPRRLLRSAARSDRVGSPAVIHCQRPQDGNLTPSVWLSLSPLDRSVRLCGPVRSHKQTALGRNHRVAGERSKRGPVTTPAARQLRCIKCGRIFNCRTNRVCSSCQRTDRTCETCGAEFRGNGRRCAACLRRPRQCAGQYCLVKAVSALPSTFQQRHARPSVGNSRV